MRRRWRALTPPRPTRCSTPTACTPKWSCNRCPHVPSTIGGRTWLVFPSGRITQNDRDEFGLMFVHGTGADRTVRVTRYSPVGSRSRERSLVELSDADLERLFESSQSSDTSPEANYQA